MCSSPISLPNPYYGLGSDTVDHNVKLRLSRSLNFLKNTKDSHILVPCNSCQECCSLRQAYVNQRVQMESLRSHLYMFTLTYKDSMLVRTDIGEYKVSYPFYDDVTNMFKRLRQKGHKFRYWIVSEYGTSEEHTKRPHYHGILAIEKKDPKDKFEFRKVELFWSQLLLKEWRRNVGSCRNPEYRNLCDYKSVWRNGRWNRTYDFHYIEPIKDHDNDVSFYVSKYVLKYDDRIKKLLCKIKFDSSLSDQETKDLISMIKPRSIMSKDFGDYRFKPIADYILSCLERSDKLPQFYDMYTGQSSLLSRYYRKLIPTSWLVNRFMLYSQFDDSFNMSDDMEIYDYVDDAEIKMRKAKKFDSVKKLLKSRY